MKISHRLLTLKLFQTCMSFCLLLNIKEDILKNVGNKQPGASFIKCCAETILNLILRLFLRYAYERFIEWTYEQKSHIRISFRCEIYESQIILNLHAIDWFQLSAL